MPSAHFISHYYLDSPVTRYRCLTIAEALKENGWDVQCSWVRDESVQTVTADLVVLHRIFWDEEIDSLVKKLKAAGKAVLYGVDDLTFTLDWPLKEASDLMPEGGWLDIGDRASYLDVILNSFANTRKTMEMCDAVLASTDLIAERARSLGKEAFVIRNALSQDQVRLSEEARAARFHRPNDIVLGYLSGSGTHNADFSRIESILETVMSENNSVTLLLAGPLWMSSQLRNVAGRVRVMPTVPWQILPSLISSIDLNLSSLDTSYTFNYGKSNIKWLEAAAVGVPTVASCTPEFERCIEDGKTGLLVRNSVEWDKAIRKMISDPELRASIGSAAYLASKDYHALAQGQEISGLFLQLLELYGSNGAPASVVFPRKIVAPPPPAPKKALPHRIALYPFKLFGNLYRAARSAFMGEYPF